MSHANQLNFLPADRNQQSVNSVAFYDPNKFGSSNPAAVPSYEPGPFFNENQETAMHNSTGSSWQPHIDPANQWNFNINNGQSWPVAGAVGQSPEYQNFQQPMHFQQGQLEDVGTQWIQDQSDQEGGALAQWNYNQQDHAGGAGAPWSHNQQYNAGDAHAHWPPHEATGVNSYDTPGYFPSNALYPATGAHFSQSYGLPAPAVQQTGIEGYNAFVVQDYSNQIGQLPAIIGNELPKVNSFEGSLNQPSPFDDIVSDLAIRSELAEPVDTSHTHSRNSSYGGVNFLIGGSENASECHSNADSPRAFVRESIGHKVSSLGEGESVDDAHAITGAFAEIALGHSNEPAYNATSIDNTDSLSTPPKMLPPHSTMAGTPTGNQFRIRKPVNSLIGGSATPSQNELPLDTSSGPLSNQNIGSVTGDCGQSRTIETHEAVSGPDIPISSSEHGATAGIQSVANDHLMNIYASPIMPHKDSSFTPVASGSYHSTALYQKANPHSAMAVERESSASESSHLDAEEIENDALLEIRQVNAIHIADKVEESLVVGNSPPKPIADIAVSRTNKARREATLSPATTLWENPEPVGVRLVPAMAAGVVQVEVKQYDDRSPVADLLQNTGTGPSRLHGTVEPGVVIEGRVPANSSRDQPVLHAPERHLPASSMPHAVHPVLYADALSSKSGQSDNILPKDIPLYAVHEQPSISSGSEQLNHSSPAGSKQLSNTGIALDVQPSSFEQSLLPSVDKVKIARDQSSSFQVQHDIVPPRTSSNNPSNISGIAGHAQSQIASVADIHSGAIQQGRRLDPRLGSDGQVQLRDAQREPALVDNTGREADLRISGNSIEGYSRSTVVEKGSMIRDDRRQEFSVVDRDIGHDRKSDIFQSDQLRSEGPQRFAQDQSHERGPMNIPSGGKHERPVSRQDGDNEYRRQSDIEEYDRHRPRPDSRRGYSDQRHERPQSRNNVDERRGKTSSRSDYNDKYDRQYDDRPSSRQGREDSRYSRPHSVQSVDEYERPRSRHDEPIRSGSRREYDDRYDERPRSRLDDSYRSGSRKEYDDSYYDGSRSRLDDSYRGGPRRGYEDQSVERPRSRQGYGDENSESRSSRPGDPNSKFQPPDSRYRPRSRHDYPDEYDSDRRRYDDGRLERPSSRPDLPDDPYSRSRGSGSSGYKSNRRPDEDYRRPRSRQDERSSTNGDSNLTRQQRMDYDRYRSDSDRSRPEYGGHRGGYGYYDPYSYGYSDSQYQNYYQGYPRDPREYYYYPEAMDPRYLEQLNDYYKGYIQELSGMSGPYPPQVYDPRYGDGRQSGGVLERGSRHSSTRASVEDLSAADHFARMSERSSRPGSVLSGSGRAPSVISISQEQSYADYDVDLQYPSSRSIQEPVLPQRMTPHKFIIPHMRVSFGSAGRLIRILPNSPADGQPALLEIIDFTELLANSDEAQTLKQFPGPLVRVETHKNDVLHYCQHMTSLCRSTSSFIDRESAELLWRFLELLIKQNGTLIGTDIADLLLDGHEPPSRSFSRVHDSHSVASKTDGQYVDGSRDSITPDRTVASQDSALTENSTAELTDRFRHLLLHGRKKDALEWAVKKNLWGHALFLASKMDAKTHASILTRFANISMKVNDPLQTLYQIMSGRQPAASTLAADEKWGDWRPHLSIILSNATQRPELDRKSIITLGDTLASRGLVYSSHFCYLVVSMMMSRDENNVNGLFGPHSSKSSKLVLIGASHSVPFEDFTSNLAAIQCTEVYEYSMSLGNPQFILPSFQLFRFMYLVRLVDYGLFEEALRYAEVLARIIALNPHLFPSSMARSLYHLADKLRYCDPQRAASEESENPEWMQQLAAVTQAMEDGRIVYQQQQPFGAVGVHSMQSHVSGGGTPQGGHSTYAGSECGDTSGVNLLAGYQQQSNASMMQTQAPVIDGTTHESYPGPPISGFENQKPVQSYASGIGDPMLFGTSFKNEPQIAASYPVPSSETGYNDGQLHVVPSGYPQAFIPSIGPPVQTSETHESFDQQARWNQHQPVLQSVPESSSSYLTSNSQEFEPHNYTAAGQTDQREGMSSGYEENYSVSSNSSSTGLMAGGSNESQRMFATGYSGYVTNDATQSLSSQSYPPPSLSRQRTTSSSSSTHSQSGPGSRRDSLAQAAHHGSGSVSNQLEGTNAPLGANLPQKKKTYWPGQELDDEDNGSGKKSANKSAEINRSKDDVANRGWLSRLFPGRQNRPKEMILPDDKNPSIVWDPKLNRYVDKDDEGKDGVDGADKRELPPPTDSEVQQKQMPSALPASVGGPNGARMTYNRPKVRGARGQYVDVLGGMTKPATAPNSLFSVLPKSASMPASIFVPNAMAANQQEAEAVGSNPEQTDESSQFQNLPPETTAANVPSTASYPNSRSKQSQPAAVPPMNDQVPMTPSLPLMFNPAQVNIAGPQSHSAAAVPGTGIHYGQRRQYPQK